MIDNSYNRHFIEMVVNTHRLNETAADALRSAHEIDVRSDADGNITYVDGSQDFPTWMRKVEAERPYLIGRGSASSSDSTPQTTAPATMGAAMDAVRAGRLTAQQAVDGYFAAQKSKASAPVKSSEPFNLSKAMLAARQGDARAIEQINAHLNAKIFN